MLAPAVHRAKSFDRSGCKILSRETAMRARVGYGSADRPRSHVGRSPHPEPDRRSGDLRVTGVAFQADQLFFSAPGGIGTYVRELVPAMAAAEPSLDVRLFHARFAGGRPEPWMAAFSMETLPHPISRLYPAWNTLGRPRLPASLSGLDVLHAPSCAGLPPAGPGQRLVVTVHDLAFRLFPRLFPASWRNLLPAGPAPRRPPRRRDHHGVAQHRRGPGPGDQGRPGPRPRDPARGVASRVGATDRAGPGTPAGVQALRPVRGNPGAAEEPGPTGPRVPARGGNRPAALAGPGRAAWAGAGSRCMRELALAGPGNVILTGRAEHRDLDALYRGAAAFLYPSVYEGFGLPVLEAMSRGRADVDVERLLAARGGRRRRPARGAEVGARHRARGSRAASTPSAARRSGAPGWSGPSGSRGPRRPG